jgi:anhydro-N-acetylmuramic acid kinase
MSGTSLDGIDAVLVRFSGTSVADVQWSVRAFVSTAYSPQQRQQIHDAIVRGTPADLCRLNTDLGEWFASAALAVCDAAGVSAGEVDLIGSHGQTIWHIPRAGDIRGATLQLGDPATIAERTGISVVSDFRSRDVAAGGQGAPLVPWQDRVLFSLPGRRRVLVNIGGIANLTWLPPKGDLVPLVAFDTGPGNILIDAAVEMATGGRETFDRDGRRAARGRVDESLAAEVLAHPFFQQPPPKSTGREVFGRPYLESLVRQRAPADEQAWADLVATMTVVTARSIADAIRRWVLARGVDEVIVSGGGARNPMLLALLGDAPFSASLPILTGEALGIDPDAKEAIAFAALAWAYATAIPANVAEATGAQGPRVLGSYTPGTSK